MRLLAIIDGEHYPPVVRYALERLGETGEVVGAAFAGGTEKVDLERDALDVYGVPVYRGATPEEALRDAIALAAPDAVVDLSDEPVVSSADRFRLAGTALLAGCEYRGADFSFSPPAVEYSPATPALAIIGTGKRVGKTALSAYAARLLASRGTDLVVLAMGRGGPADPEVIRGEEVALTTEDLVALARQGKHASSDNYEDAVMARVTTVGSRRCGGGMSGSTFFGNVAEGARVADGLGKELVVVEGSGAAIPPVASDARLLVVGAGQGMSYVRDYFGPYRLALADAVVVATAEEPVIGREDLDALLAEISRQRPDVPVVATTFRPAPITPVEGKVVFFATTAPPSVLPKLVEHLERVHGCEVAASSPHLSDRARLREDMRAARGRFDLLLTELKAAAIDVVAAAGEEAGVPTVLCDNVPVAIREGDLDGMLTKVAALARERAAGRG